MNKPESVIEIETQKILFSERPSANADGKNSQRVNNNNNDNNDNNNKNDA